ncbi:MULTISPECIES: MarR family winged helix-turn-helix transcriptional regulator [unclassified Rhizobium]|uniref:MarR family winged helix-turn-helix transcriptional regulator n=1 Tax=unclassified Rhizobium TaxID=2613769 RepID=UPI001C82DCCD|nr:MULTISPECIES: MarR family transcriptional regulator [unclassified Rhizobium]MBX5157854.1 MarR family transcriptional regulator [Rhizobium sp. NZLR8]MBX5164877.1 MarR family transcriptional regulator [Rhizobium sp. NZLR4b]MBX5209692.1 MarR family transcriptional regulator [Rhizobium sp. NZLR11]
MTNGIAGDDHRSPDKGRSGEDHVDRLRRQWAVELPDLDTEPMAILGRTFRLSNLVRPSIEATFADFGLDRGEFDVIATLRRSGPPYRLTPTDIYSALMISSGGLTHRLDRLEKAGLIRREKSQRDGRSVLVALSEAGAAHAEKAFRTDMAGESAFLQALDANEREALATLLRKLLAGIENDQALSGNEDTDS